MSISQQDLARMCGVSQPHLNNMFKGRRRLKPKIAASLEAATGKHRLYWLYPDEFDETGNPLPLTPPAPAAAPTPEAGE